jgi:hypothetical protein
MGFASTRLPERVARSVPRTVRQPSERMAAAGDPSLWAATVEIAITEGEAI